jgi:hypothetical protein
MHKRATKGCALIICTERHPFKAAILLRRGPATIKKPHAGSVAAKAG